MSQPLPYDEIELDRNVKLEDILNSLKVAILVFSLK